MDIGTGGEIAFFWGARGVELYVFESISISPPLLTFPYGPRWALYFSMLFLNPYPPQNSL